MQFSPNNMEYQGENTPANEAWGLWLANQGDPYGARVFSYAKDWAEGVEARLANGEQFIDVVEAESDKADTDGITGLMYGAAVSMLAKLWVHGEALRRWHNKEIQLGTEGDQANDNGGVLYPAMIHLK